MTTQTINPDTATAEECALWLAGLECATCDGGMANVLGSGELLIEPGSSDTPAKPGTKGFGLIRCPDCGGTGQALRYPTLRKPCIPGKRSHERYYVNKVDGSLVSLANCSRCQGRNWMPVVDLETLLNVREARLWILSPPNTLASAELVSELGRYRALGNSILEAAYRALVKAELQREDSR